MDGHFIGLDIGGTKLAAVLGTADGRVLEKLKRPSEASKGPQQMLDKLFDMADQLMQPDVLAIGVSCGGPLDSRRGVIMSPPNLPGWDNIHLIDMLQRRFGVPAYGFSDVWDGHGGGIDLKRPIVQRYQRCGRRSGAYQISA